MSRKKVHMARKDILKLNLRLRATNHWISLRSRRRRRVFRKEALYVSR